jgi:hypothetical protein
MMSLRQWVLLFIVISVGGAMTGCSGTLHLAPSPTAPYNTSRGRPVSGEACGFQLMAFFPIKVMSRNERAYEQMLEEAGGDVVTDIKMQERWSFAVVGWNACTTITGTAYPRT